MKSQKKVTLKRVPEFPDYFVSEEGEVYSARRKGKFIKLRPQKNRDGYLYLTLWDRNNRRRNMFVHRLVLSAYTGGDRPGIPVDHINGDRADNRLANLRWVESAAENLYYARQRRGGRGWGPRGTSNWANKLTPDQVRMIRRLAKAGATGAELARRFGVTPQMISDLLKRKKWAWLPD